MTSREVPLRWGVGGPVIGSASVTEDDHGLRIEGSLVPGVFADRLLQGGCRALSMGDFSTYTLREPEISEAIRADFDAMLAEMRDPATDKCGCGFPEKPCLRVMLRNGPPFPARPCEPGS